MEYKIKHLEMIQSIINRLAGNSFIIKGWSITLSLAGFGLFLERKIFFLLILIVFSTIIFWLLDSYYLRQERLFRRLYEDTTNRSANQKVDFSMDISKYQEETRSLVFVMFSFPTLLIYSAILIMTLIVYLTTK